ncbi:M28 family peptidase [Pilimelia columellifera]|uniref:M28 family metallopeptidase n=1 Tax=Pilimelia columellifera subsp. columellifera TaxID=706583 RepID=A0ABN3N9X5_9ACTN
MLRLRALLASGTAVTLSAVLTLAYAPQSTAATATTTAALVRVDPPTVPDETFIAHLRQFQRIADENGGTRYHGRPGYKASVDYVASTLTAAGYQVTTQPFTYSGATSWNLVAEWPHGDANKVVMVGAHLDSVSKGPGINDNATGSAAVLENALLVARSNLRPDKRLRFAWWGTEELGLVGSKHYVASLSAADKKRIEVYLNFDMVGTKGLTKWRVYKESPDLSAQWKAYFRTVNVATEDYNAGSDQISFNNAGIKVSGFGGKMDDKCYHLACDTLSNNIDPRVMGISGNAIAYLSWKLAGAKAAAGARPA